MKKPAVGDKIVHFSPHGERVGVVDHVMAEQFAYETEDGLRDISLFRDNWNWADGKPQPSATRSMGRLDVYNAWVDYRKQHLGGRGTIKVQFEGEVLPWSTAIYHPSTPTSLTLIFKDGAQEEHTLVA